MTATEMEGKNLQILPESTPTDADQASPTISDVKDYCKIWTDCFQLWPKCVFYILAEIEKSKMCTHCTTFWQWELT